MTFHDGKALLLYGAHVFLRAAAHVLVALNHLTFDSL